MTYTDLAIIKAIIDNQKHLDDCLKYLYKNLYKKTVSFFKGKGMNEDEIKDLFQDAIIVFYEMVKNKKFRTDAQISTFIFSVMKYKWINNLKKKITKTEFERDDIEELDGMNIEEKIIKKEKQQIVLNYINKLQENCKKILVDYYYNSMSMKDIAQRLGYKNDQIARNRKMLCMKALQEIIKSNPIT